MPMYLFRLAPGQETRYRIAPIGPAGAEAPRLCLVALRPTGTREEELELILEAEGGRPIGKGFVRRDAGYPGVRAEVSRQLAETGWASDLEFDLVRERPEPGEDQAPEAGGRATW